MAKYTTKTDRELRQLSTQYCNALKSVCYDRRNRTATSVVQDLNAALKEVRAEQAWRAK